MAHTARFGLIHSLQGLGAFIIWFIQELGAICLFFAEFVKSMFARHTAQNQLTRQMEFVGVGSLPLILLTAFFTGGVLALQSFHGLGGATLGESQLGNLVSLSMLRELGPVLAGLMLASRVGAAMAAELGTMKVTEQIDALITLATNPIRYLVVPRIVACLLMLPLLVLLANALGIIGGWVVAVHVLGIDGNAFLHSAFDNMQNEDILMGIVKATVFGLLVGLMATFHGFNAGNGAAGVGEATTRAVVYAAVAILVSDYFITAAFI